MNQIRIGLTPRQAEVLHYIKVYYNEYGYYPTVRDICKGKVSDQKVIKPMVATSNAHRILNGAPRANRQQINGMLRHDIRKRVIL